MRISDWSSDVCSSDLGEIGMSTAWRISDAVPAPRSFEFRKRALHVGAAIGIHPIAHDEIYYVVSGTGIVRSDDAEKDLKPGMAAWLYKGARGSEEHTSELQSLMRISYAVFCLKKKKQPKYRTDIL